MSNPITKIFQFGDGGTHDASISENSQSQEVSFQHGFSISPLRDVLGGGIPNYTVQVSPDNLNWFDVENATGVPLDEAVEKYKINFLYVRVVYSAGASTTGTISFILILKR